MSHFSVLVITAERPDDDALAKIMAPWHEFECTGIDDKYVQNIDRTDEVLAEFKLATVTRLKAPDGELHDRFTADGEWKPEFSRPGELGRREAFVPPGFEEVEVAASSVETAAAWITGEYGWEISGQVDGEKLKYGYIEVDGDGEVVRCVDRTNPNKKWDWWVVGGRWSGLLRLKAYATPELGRRGLLGACADDHKLASDRAMLRDVDLRTMREEAATIAGALWDEVAAVVAGLDAPEDFVSLRERIGDIEAARTAYWEQPAVVALKAAFPNSWGLDRELAAASSTRDAHVKRASDAALTTFAVVKDGQWHERGGMGWFGVVHDEKDQDAWAREFAALIDGLPESVWLTVVDCHI